MEKLFTNLLAAYNEAIDSSRMEEHVARLAIEAKYKVRFVGLNNKTGRYTGVEAVHHSPVIESIMKVADIQKQYVSSELQRALIGKSAYIDNDSSCREHIYYPSQMLDNPEEYEFTLACKAELQVILSMLEISSCAYFRIIK